MKNNTVCLVGAGSIADAHAHALKDLGRLAGAGLVEPSAARREKFARTWGLAHTFDSLDAMLAEARFDCIHILTPPDTHADLAAQVIAAGRHVLVEKPVAERSADALASAAQAAARGVVAAVNQNFVHHPAFAKLKQAVARGAFGPLRHVVIAYDVPLRQLAARQFGHWMFREPKNILLEQAVHPLSQLVALTGPVDRISAIAPPGLEIAPGVQLCPVADCVLQAGPVTAHLQFAVGRAFPLWQVTAICDDGVLIADILANRFYTLDRGRWMEQIDALLSGVRTAGQLIGAAVGNIADFALSLAKLKGRSDPFYLSMKGSIAAFYRRVGGDANAGATDFAFGAEVVRICEEIARQCFPQPAGAAPRPAATGATCDVALLGGTGFIGSATVAALRRAGLSVRVMARSVTNLSDVFHQDGVTVMRGDVTRAEDVARAVAGATYVVNLAHGGGGSTWTEVERALVGSAEIVADASVTAGAKRLVHVGSIAGLYLGDPADVVTGQTPPDPQSHDRADYARAKAMADAMLLKRHRDNQLPVVILRPGVVVGAGTSPFHSGLGMFNADQHCLGWNDGRNPLPFVLVDDVAAAIVTALQADGIDGRCYNLVGDARPSAREFIAELAKVTRRPLKFHPGSARMLYAEEYGKWLVKRVAGRRVPPPSQRDLRSRGLVATFDCADAKRDLGWAPQADRAAFYAGAFAGLAER
ncbi:MAG: NAD-dependent epimerase/dehydratase family protein [Rhodospirillaceae bacterium]|nr:NAD-dependent epimerase/dehydratase family protein [Rhodospirillaceae bacterium]